MPTKIIQTVIYKKIIMHKISMISNNVKTNNSRFFFYIKRFLTSNVYHDFDYLCNEANRKEIEDNIRKRKQIGDISKVINLWKKLNNNNYNYEEKEKIEQELKREASLIPNKSSPHLLTYGDLPKVIKYINEKPSFNFQAGQFEILGERHHMLKCSDSRLSLFIGPRGYCFTGALADLEQSLIRYTVSNLLKKGFTLVSVPDILYEDVIQKCGVETGGESSKVYFLPTGLDRQICLSGTAEMAIGGFLQNRKLSLEELPLKFAAVSRCYRREIGDSSMDRGIYRVPAFTKVEMFGVTADESGNESMDLFKELVYIQIELFSPLGFHFQVIDMPLNDLGAPAYTKIDIEAWIPVQDFYGEISSASNCTDFQSRRLNIRYKDANGNYRFAHTVNGTACAIPRCLMAVVSSNQREKGVINIPPVLRQYMGGSTCITPSGNPTPLQVFRGQTYDGKIVNREELEKERSQK